MDVAGKAIQLSNNESRLVQTTEAKRFGNRGPIAPFSALDFHNLLDELPMAPIQVTAHGLPLRFQAQTARALPRRRNSQVGNESAFCHLPRLRNICFYQR